VTENVLPFIPISDFWPSGVKQLEASFILVGLTAIKFDFTLDGLRVIYAGLILAAAPLPATIWQFGTSRAGLVGFCKRRKTDFWYIKLRDRI